MTKLDLAIALSAVLVAFVAVLGTPEEASAGEVCTWFIACETENPDNCWIESYQCGQSQGDCEAICDWEEQQCITECVYDEGGSQVECQDTCRPIWFQCNKNCIPSL